MINTPSPENDFIAQVTTIIEKNISNEQFGVSGLADEMNMSRSNLLRKVKGITNLSVSQLINQVRLTRAMEMLRTSSLNVSEVSHQVGFGSTSYFIKCFREYYGYPPGEVGEHDVSPEPAALPGNGVKARDLAITALAITLIIVVGLFFYNRKNSATMSSIEKSIAVLPFKNESNDSTNVYLINGLMESTLNNLQKIKELKVISRTSSEIYRNSTKSVPQIAKELNVNYFIEGSGQKIGDNIVLNIQLIEAVSDKHLWAKQYRRETKDIFQLQEDIAKNIVEEIQVVISPEEEKEIRKKVTNDLVAYDFYLKGREILYGIQASPVKAIPYFKKAVERDPNFAAAYADATISYYYLDYFQAQPRFSVEISEFADKALLHDPNSAESLVAKALVHMHRREYESAIPYLERALEYNPNSGLVIHFLSELYNLYAPNTSRYLEYALRGVRINLALNDSSTTSMNYMNLSNALIQNGFIEEAELYIDKSLQYNPRNPFAIWVRIGILHAKTHDLKRTRELLTKEFNSDTSKFYLMNEIGKTSYTLRDYPTAYAYYSRLLHYTEANKLNMYESEKLIMASVFQKMGKKNEAERFLADFKTFADKDKTIYHDLEMMAYFAYTGDRKKALEHLILFSKKDDVKYWVLLMKEDPIVDSLKDLPGYDDAIKAIEERFWSNHKKMRKDLVEKGLL